MKSRKRSGAEGRERSGENERRKTLSKTQSSRTRADDSEENEKTGSRDLEKLRELEKRQGASKFSRSQEVEAKWREKNSKTGEEKKSKAKQSKAKQSKAESKAGFRV